MRGCTITCNGVTTSTVALDIVQEKKSLGSPSPDTYTVKIPGRNGSLNLTKALTGDVCYSNRTIELQYCIIGTREHIQAIKDTINTWHGEEITLIDGDTPDWNYHGIATVSFTDSSSYSTAKIKIDAYPFRQKNTPTTKSANITKSGTLSITNTSKRSVPFTVTLSAGFTISDGTTSVTLGQAGTYTIDNFKVKPGTNKFTLTGTGTVSMSFTEEMI